MEINSFGFEAAPRREFIAFGEKAYEGDPNRIPGSERGVARRLSPSHPIHRSIRTRNFLLRERGAVRARLTAFLNLRGAPEGEITGSIGHFEALEGVDTRPLLEAGLEFLRSEGVARVHAPVDGTTWYPYRFVAGGSAGPPFIGEPYNPPFYPSRFTEAGFSPLRGYVSARITEIDPYIEETRGLDERFTREGYTVRSFRSRDARILHRLVHRAFEGNYGFTPRDFDEFRRETVRDLSILPTGSVLLAYGPDGAAVAFIVAMPDYGDLLRRCSGSRIRAFLGERRHRPTRLIVRTLGSTPGLHRVAPGRVLLSHAYRLARNRGCTEIVHAHMAEGSESSRINSRYADPDFRRYTLFVREMR